MFEHIQDTILQGVHWLRLLIETLGAVVIAIGIALTIYGLARHMLKERDKGFIKIRLKLARYLTLALEMQLAADVLSTSIAPTWEQIGKLAAIAVIRTMLNFFLNREMRHEKAEESDG